MKRHRYRNPWHNPAQSSPRTAEFFESDNAPIKHSGVLIYRRGRGPTAVFDIVISGVCVAQRAGLTGAKSAIDDPDNRERWGEILDRFSN